MPGAANQVISGDIPSKLNHLNVAVSLFLQISLVSAFLGVFYFTYVDKIEREIIIGQVSSVVSDFTSTASFLMSPLAKQSAREYFSKLVPVDMSEQDAAAEKKNGWLEKQAFILLGTLILCGILFFIGHAIFVYKSGYIRESAYVLIESLIMLTCIGVTEFCFLTVISRNFFIADPNVIKKEVVDKLIEFQTSYKKTHVIS